MRTSSRPRGWSTSQLPDFHDHHKTAGTGEDVDAGFSKWLAGRPDLSKQSHGGGELICGKGLELGGGLEGELEGGGHIEVEHRGEMEESKRGTPVAGIGVSSGPGRRVEW
jgi:hypothetical protein